MNRSVLFPISFIFSFIIVSCTIAPPVINITGEKTVIERQIVGDYRELEKDAWILSSVKTNIQRKGYTVVIGGDRILFTAMKIREYHMDKIRDYKDEGAIGEMNTGYVQYRSTLKYDRDRDLKELLFRVINEENKARGIIFKRSLIRSGVKDPDNEEIRSIGMKFAEEQRELAQKNDWIQNESGNWIRKE
jgi:hypothetical protein